MRRKDREMSKEFALQVTDSCDYAVLSAVTNTGSPYCVPLSIVRIENNLYFHSATEGKKLDILRENPNVCVACVTGVHAIQEKFTTAYSSAIIEGKAEEITAPQEKITALRAICMRYAPDNMTEFDTAIEKSLNHTAVFKISIDKITGKCKKEK